MKLVKKTDAYSVYQKRSGRYGVKNTQGKWVNAQDKVEILSKEKLITLPKSKPKEEAPAEEAAE